jgi:ATP-dependent exoDNAse (exonuclease V) alpha subunit
MQVILVGDLFQLPPVERNRVEHDFCYKSEAWAALDLKICYLTEQHRQEGEDRLLQFLISMRQTKEPADRVGIMSIASNAKAPDSVTKLFSHNVDVDAVNQEHLDALTGKPHTYKMHSEGRDQYKVEALRRNILAPETLVLKEGAQVMFVANNFQDGFVNGSQGQVLKFNKQGDPVIKLKSGKRIVVDRHTWKTEEDGITVAEVEQLPLRLAWAITIHKSQGMSLDAAEIDLTGAFTPGMGYVALSRVRSLSGLYLRGMNDMALTMHPEIYELDLQLREASK